MSFSVEKSEILLFLRPFLKIPESFSDSSKIGESFPEILIPKAEKSGFPKNLLFHYLISPKNHFFLRFFRSSFFPAVFCVFLFRRNFSDFFLVPVCSFSRKFIFSSVFSFFPEISFSENVKIQRIK